MNQDNRQRSGTSPGSGTEKAAAGAFLLYRQKYQGETPQAAQGGTEAAQQRSGTGTRCSWYQAPGAIGNQGGSWYQVNQDNRHPAQLQHRHPARSGYQAPAAGQKGQLQGLFLQGGENTRGAAAGGSRPHRGRAAAIRTGRSWYPV